MDVMIMHAFVVGVVQCLLPVLYFQHSKKINTGYHKVTIVYAYKI